MHVKFVSKLVKVTGSTNELESNFVHLTVVNSSNSSRPPRVMETLSPRGWASTGRGALRLQPCVLHLKTVSLRSGPGRGRGRGREKERCRSGQGSWNRSLWDSVPIQTPLPKWLPSCSLSASGIVGESKDITSIPCHSFRRQIGMSTQC